MFTADGMVVRAVLPNSKAEQAGIQQGDCILDVDGQAIANDHDWQAIRASTEVGLSQRFEVGRGNERFQRVLTFQRIPLGRFKTPLGWAELTYFVLALTAFVVGLGIAFRKPNDLVAIIGAWLMVTASTAFGLPAGWAATWRHLPALLGALLWIPHISRFVFDGILITFFALFPRPLFRSRWPWILVWAPVLLLLPWRVFATYSVIYLPDQATGAPKWIFRLVDLRTVVYLIGTVVAIGVSYRRLEDINQRRRVRVLVAGVTVGLLAATAYILIERIRPTQSVWEHAAVLAALYVLCMAFPLSFAYAIFRHRMFDISVMLRLGLQYALARRLVLSLVPGLAMLLLADLVLHRSEPLVSILRARGWVYAGLCGVALLVHAKRKVWLEALDRRFFREHYDSQRLLRDVVEEVHRAGSFEKVAPRVVTRIEAALHAEFVALLAREPKGKSFHSLASAPSGQTLPPLPADSKLVALVRVLEKPLEVPHSETGWLQQQLLQDEADFIRNSRIDLLVPVAVVPGRREALLVLAAKRSEEPYSREDQDLLAVVAASLALLLDRQAAGSGPASDTFEECPQCGLCYDAGAGRCTQDGMSLIPLRLARLLAGRYRLERRRGRGGMGAVYEAVDTSLNRKVAVKVIREDLVGSAEAAERFRREARSAAGFAHPNVVTVHDFGVVADTRAFLVMELLQGLTIREELERRKQIEPSRAVVILRGVCNAVEAAHGQQLVHRDLKPENVFLTRTDTTEIPKILDFGIAKFMASDTQATTTTSTTNTSPGQLVGTIAYISPEQWLGHPVETGWDLWALAVVTYEMLTRARPFAGATGAELRSSVLAGRFTPLTRYLPEAPARWQDCFSRAFAVERSNRPGSAREFFSDFERAFS